MTRSRFNRRELVQFATSELNTHPESASQAFTALEKNARMFGLDVICPLAHCRGDRCLGPHRIGVAAFMQLDRDTLLAGYQIGPAFADILLAFQAQLAAGEGA